MIIQDMIERFFNSTELWDGALEVVNKVAQFPLMGGLLLAVLRSIRQILKINMGPGQLITNTKEPTERAAFQAQMSCSYAFCRMCGCEICSNTTELLIDVDNIALNW
ncbi:hypothetical protein WA026_016983 [Henosepilachna vigintioctopunctata]|uniref:Uncharacterized protein n=1 Tax=Henosepilachna vigintioctopunctata TaxID=420089 RepID=A0AAW1U9H5_9CUCU